MPLPVQRPANAVASIAVRRRQLVSGSSIRRRRHPLGRGNRHAARRSYSGRRSERARGSPLASSVCALAPSLAGLQWRRASALLAGVLLLALLGTRLLASGDRRARSAHPRALARTTDAHVPARRPASARRPSRAAHSSIARATQPAAPGRATALGRTSETRRRSPALQLVPPISPRRAPRRRLRRRRPPAASSPTSGSDRNLEREPPTHDMKETAMLSILTTRMRRFTAARYVLHGASGRASPDGCSWLRPSWHSASRSPSSRLRQGTSSCSIACRSSPALSRLPA